MASQRAPEHDWVLIYYMAYDNNLELWGPQILNCLETGIKESDLVVTILADDTCQNGLKRYTLTSEGRKTERLDTENSASQESLREYLCWVATHYPANHYAVIFLNHGGRLDEMCLDEWTGEVEAKQWLSAQQVGSVMRQFRKDAPGEVELLFLQQCGRGSLENLYNFRGAAASVMASQMSVGAPNTYYEGMLKWLIKNKYQATGVTLAQQIMAHDEQFSHYVCIDATVMEELPTILNPVLESLLSHGKPLLKPQKNLRACFSCKDETYYDLLNWLEATFRQNNQSTESLAQFQLWFWHKLISAIAVAPYEPSEVRNLCGLSLFVPGTRQSYEGYHNYPIYQDTRLGHLWKQMYPHEVKT